MKYKITYKYYYKITVLPLAREWIEILKGICGIGRYKIVLPLAREWIEMVKKLNVCTFNRFSLLRGSGLKLKYPTDVFISSLVLPLAREWIEISFCLSDTQLASFSLLRGSGLK